MTRRPVSAKVTGLAQKLQVGPRFCLQIPIDDLMLAQLLGQSCNFYARARASPERGALWLGSDLIAATRQSSVLSRARALPSALRRCRTARVT